MGERKTVAALVVGGEANAGPPLGPALGPLGVNVMAIVKQINDLTGEYAGMRVPIKVHVESETKQFEVEVGVPTTSALIAKEAGITKGSGSPKATLVGNLTMAQVVRIARAKAPQSYGSSLRSMTREVVGSCISMGIKVEERDPRDTMREIAAGKWDQLLTVDSPSG
jgi:large subunit ribosomal protein L11